MASSRCSPATHVIEPGDGVAQGLGGDGGLLGHPHVAGTAGGHHDAAPALQCLGEDHRQPGQGVVAHREALREGVGGLLIDPGHQDVGALAPLHGSQDPQDLLRGFGLAEDHLCRPLAHRPVIIHLGIAQILKGGEFQPQQRPLGSQVSVPDVLQDR